MGFQWLRFTGSAVFRRNRLRRRALWLQQGGRGGTLNNFGGQVTAAFDDFALSQWLELAITIHCEAFSCVCHRRSNPCKGIPDSSFQVRVPSIDEALRIALRPPDYKR